MKTTAFFVWTFGDVMDCIGLSIAVLIAIVFFIALTINNRKNRKRN